MSRHSFTIHHSPFTTHHSPMDFSTIIGSLGVTLLLIGFFLNLFKFISQESILYILLNIIGAGLSCYASVLIHYIPFVILEGTWCLVAAAAFVKKMAAFPINRWNQRFLVYLLMALWLKPVKRSNPKPESEAGIWRWKFYWHFKRVSWTNIFYIAGWV